MSTNENAKEFSLSSYQRDIWLEQCMHPGKPIYNLGGYIRIKGNIDIEIFRNTMLRIINQNDTLRTRLMDRAGEAYLTILPKIHYKAPFLDFSMKENPAAFCAEWIKKEFLKPFDPNDYFFQFYLLKSNENEYFILLKVYHMIIDGWGFALLYSQMIDTYNELAKGNTEIKADAYSYTDFIAEDQEYRNSPAFLKDIEFWKNKYQTIPEPLLSKGIGYDCENDSSVWSDRSTLKIKKVLYNRMLEFCKEENSSAFHYLLGILYLYFSKVCKQKDLVIGVPVFNRSNAKYKQTMGHFANVLPLRINPETDMSFKELMKLIRHGLFECYRHKRTNFGDISRAVYEGVSEKGNLFDISLSFEEQEMRKKFVTADECQNVTMTHQHERNALMLLIWGHEGEADVCVNFDYRLDVFRKFIPIENFISHFEYLFTKAMEHGDTPISAIEVVPEAEKRMLLHDFNQTVMEYSKDQTIHGLFEEQAEQRPEHTALVFEDKKLTYRELNQKANRLAHALRRKGVKPDSIVAVMTERSLDMVTGIFGTLKAGGAYLPIDPGYPEDRIEYMLEDSGAGVLLTQKHLKDRIQYNGKMICLDDEEAYLEADANPESVNKPDDLAYIIYTSGSTGKPKGVMVEHHGILNLQNYFKESWGVDGSDRMLQFASSSFDASVWETFTILLGGGTLYLVSRDVINNLDDFKNFIIENKITITLLPPAYLSGIEPGSLPSLKKLVTGGSAITKELVSKWKDKADYMNAYGPTEYSVIATAWKYRNEEMGYDSVPIGKPVSNTRIYILDKDQKLLPVGAAGEMCVSGDGIARGYLNRQSLTAQKFVDNPYEAGEKMYRTGDLARWLPDGNVEYLGRIDDQVKIRGFRIELGEIEANLHKYPLIRDVAVIAREDKKKEKYLTAYFTSEDELKAEELKKHLLKELPDYMVPAFFMQLEHMPMTQSGKIDKKALPEPEIRGNSGADFISPRNDADKKIQEVWQDTLGIESIGIDDNFFMLGGNSIKAIQAVSRLASEFEIGINDMFQYPTIRSLSDQIKYSKDRLKTAIEALEEAAVTRIEGRGASDGRILKSLKEYHKRNQKYKEVAISEKAGYQNILVAGGTGYLGIQIVYQLLKTTDYKIYIVVRGKDDNEAQERLYAKLKFHFGDEICGQGTMEDRLCVFCGDLTKKYFGLGKERYESLAEIIDAVINSAANVKHFGNYSEFYAINVEGNKRLIEFAGTGKRKVYNFISTTSVGSGFIEGQSSVVFTEYDCDVEQSSDNYYVMTKLEAEKQIVRAREEGIICNVFRVGNLVFDSKSGIFQENIQDNAFYTMVKSLIKLGYVPAIADKTLDFSFVDQVAKAVVLLFDRKNLKNETYHLFNSHRINMITFSRFLNQAGVEVETMPVDRFTSFILKKYDDDDAKQEVSRILVHSNIFFEGASKTLFLVKNRKTDGILKTLGFEWQKLDSSRVKLMIEHCRNVGFMQ